jgi:two-component system phosphate regulon sensor histidine kinase PhoR
VSVRRLFVAFFVPVAASLTVFFLLALAGESRAAKFNAYLVSSLLGGGLAALLGALFERRLRAIETRTWPLAADSEPAPLAGDDPIDALERRVAGMDRQLRSQLARAEAERGRLEAVLRNMVDGVVVLGVDGRIVLCNAAAAVQLGIPSVGEFLGARLSALCRKPDVVGLVDELLGSTEQPSPREIVIESGQRRVLWVSAARLVEPDGRHGAILVLHDVTRLRQLEAVRADFVANVSHELRTPLTAIRGYAETLLTGALDEPTRARSFVQVIERHSERLSRLIDDLLTLSDLELGRAALHPESLSIAEAVDAAFEVVRAKADRHHIQLRTDLSPDLPPIHADRDRIEQVVINLVDNAIKYSPPDARVSVRARRLGNGDGGGAVELEVVDGGIGIPEKDIPRLTERFFRVDRARSRELGGTGLGLAIVKHIVQAHGGTMAIESRVDVGTTVRLTLPRGEA